jgi:TolA-binding protein
MSAFRGGRYDDADALLRDFIARNPGDPRIEDAAFLRMVGRARSHDPEGAAELARRYLAQFPSGLRRREAEQVLHQPR